MKLLILGGYGAFGARLVQLLADVSELQIVVSGRSGAKAQALCNRFKATAKLIPLQLDRNNITAGLANQKPDIVIDASGPFQNYGEDPYAVVRACIAAGTHYLDFADAADFVTGVHFFDEEAKAKSLFVLSGVSSFPVLTAAVVAEFAKDMKVRKVRGGIAPSPYAGIGLNVMRAVIGYAGAPVRLTRGGQPTTGTGLAESMRYTIAPAGSLPLRNTHFSLVDVPDLRLIPLDNPSITDIWMGAGPVPELLHRALNMLALIRAAFRLPSFSRLAPLFHWVLNLMKFGEHRGGMFVEVEGERNGRQVMRSWHMLAEGDDGPLIPSMAIEGVVRRFLNGSPPLPGARAASGTLTLQDYETLFAQRRISTGFWQDPDEDACLFRQCLGPAFDQLPAQVAALHQPDGHASWSGTARIERGSRPLANLIARCFGFPPSSPQAPVTVEFQASAHGERWTRHFGDARFTSTLRTGTGRNARLVTERFGPISVALALVLKDGKLFFIPRRWSLLGIPMPEALLPGGATWEEERNGKFHFHVTIEAPLIGLIASYSGNLSPSTRA